MSVFWNRETEQRIKTWRRASLRKKKVLVKRDNALVFFYLVNKANFWIFFFVVAW